jgi:hypothetical protein
MLPKVEIGVEEVPPPFGRWCSAGHVAVDKWSRGGPGTPLTDTLFYRVTSVNVTVCGTYCELCLTIANSMAAKTKMVIRNGTTKQLR